MAVNNLALGLQQISQGVGQWAQIPEMRQRLAQLQQETAMNEQRFQINKQALETARQQSANTKLASMGKEYMELEKGATPEWFNTKQKDIFEVSQVLGISEDAAKLRIKSPKTQFEESKKLALAQWDAMVPMVDTINPKMTQPALGFRTALAEAKDPDQLENVRKSNQALIQDVFTIGLKQKETQEKIQTKTGAREEKKLDTIREEMNIFRDKEIKQERDQLAQIEPIKTLMNQGQNQASYEMAKTMLIRLAGDPRPSDRDLARISPNPSFINGARRIIDQKFGNQPLEKDIESVKMVADGLEQSVMTNVRNKAKNYAISRKGLIPGIEPPELEERLLTAHGLGPTSGEQLTDAGKPPLPPSSSDRALAAKTNPPPQIPEEAKAAAYAEAQTILSNPQSSPEQKAKAQQGIRMLNQMGYAPKK